MSGSAGGADFSTRTAYTYPRCSANWLPPLWRNQPATMVAFWPSVFQPGFVDVVTVIAKRLPIVHAPKQKHVAAMRNNVIDQGGDQGASVTQVDAPGMQRQERF